MTDIDLVVRGGTVLDGTGGDAFEADVAVSGGRIVAVGDIKGCGSHEIDAKGYIVTPGFVDMHTHYDGQVTWEDTTSPSSQHGVTSIVMGNCGVGFAPCRPADRDGLVGLMESVEEIPEIVMTEGVKWNWETFPEYLGALGGLQRDVDVAAQLPHCCLRVYVMGQRGIDREPATAEDLQQMTMLSREAMEAGALGFSTSRSIFHKERDGGEIPSTGADEAELHAIALGMKQANLGVLQAIIDFDEYEENVELLGRVAKQSGRPVSFTLAQLIDYPDAWRAALKVMDRANREGVSIKGQILGRPTGMLIGLDFTFNPFSLYPTVKSIAHLPLAEKVAFLRRPEVRARILSETPDEPLNPGLNYMKKFDWIFPLLDPPNYEPSLETSIGATARRQGIRPEEAAYDLMLEEEGHRAMLVAATNFNDGTLDIMLQMMKDDNTLIGLGDGGAHYGSACDAGNPTFMLMHWTRDRRGERLPVANVVRSLTSEPAQAMGLFDRGIIAPGFKGDLNVIDYDGLQLYAPRMVTDLPAGGRRVTQRADGYVATIVNGLVTYRHGEWTGERPGRLIRGAQGAPPV